MDSYRQIVASSKDPGEKRDLPWGFSIYHCSYRDESVCNRLLQYIEEQVKADLEGNQRMDLLLHHQLVINNDMAKVNSATSHEIRNHFNEWVADQLPQVVASPEMLEYLQSQKLPDHLGPQYGLGARFDPVVKVLSGFWGNMTPQEREYQIHPDWHDGETDDELEMAGWMYIPIQTYVRSYDGLEQPGDWDEYYVRPPLMLNGSSALLHLDEELAQIDRES
ncbi:hypothetical protein DTO027I6_243 [Penicillium roqueforti]|uniref:uncharacterized protein n=1 Tax=Penicillium roqueforti TaxID=5082 RepID=UPI001909824C|nr:uncharacterized protein LCP9604111_3566 [Penicillium roqueforti]KAF9250050.1 hypothetical protein LCP9604111_3566 [Penicillium roqueforti]KAI2679501.1 hypothetical protein CBS147355_3983 [Penicillium roqueforti]KAI2717005.1 hypothetical protein CBS147318_5132 [Penicillium roqueforti]KAI3135212.1 hypothetical protein CBS147330_3264 [Penicillium roqueforti]KAI3158769.1 hypothetical protein CBS147317_4857 [Penicillium roqueforti]